VPESAIDVVPNQKFAFMNCEYWFHRGLSVREINSLMS
jgi:hypothetical protein